jgi:hypothetical protein
MPDGSNCISFCGPVVVDDEGDVAISSSRGEWFFRPDGSGSTSARSSAKETILTVAPRSRGFVASSQTHVPGDCAFLHLVDPDTTTPVAIPGPLLRAVVRNPKGGLVAAAYVNARYDEVIKGLRPTLVLRWFDDSLNPLGDWYAVTSWDVGTNNEWGFAVDELGRALVFSFFYPQTLGGKPPPSEWKFEARWLDQDGPLTETFEPVAPVFKPNSADRPQLFAHFGRIVKLIGGGFALFAQQASAEAGGTVSPAGWYVAYPSGEGRAVAPPAWLQPYGNALRPLADSRGYASTERDPNTCERTVFMIAPSGRKCFALPLQASSLCDTWTDGIWPDGTVIVETLDQVHWWPGLARPAP